MFASAVSGGVPMPRSRSCASRSAPVNCLRTPGSNLTVTWWSSTWPGSSRDRDPAEAISRAEGAHAAHDELGRRSVLAAGRRTAGEVEDADDELHRVRRRLLHRPQQFTV